VTRLRRRPKLLLGLTLVLFLLLGAGVTLFRPATTASATVALSEGEIGAQITELLPGFPYRQPDPARAASWLREATAADPPSR
jgi:hypothetical protein